MQQHLFGCWRSFVRSRPFPEQVFLAMIHLSLLANRYNVDQSFGVVFIAFVKLKEPASTNSATLWNDILVEH